MRPVALPVASAAAAETAAAAAAAAAAAVGVTGGHIEAGSGESLSMQSTGLWLTPTWPQVGHAVPWKWLWLQTRHFGARGLQAVRISLLTAPVLFSRFALRGRPSHSGLSTSRSER